MHPVLAVHNCKLAPGQCVVGKKGKECQRNTSTNNEAQHLQKKVKENLFIPETHGHVDIG